MAKWLLKALVQKGISFLPYKERINYWFQKNVTKGVDLTDAYFEQKLQHAKDHIAYFTGDTDHGLRDSHVLELGTGWYPIVPIAMFLNGAAQVRTLDLYDWLEAENVRKVCRKFMEWHEKHKLTEYLSEIDHQRWAVLMQVATDQSADLKSICQRLSIISQVGDASSTGLPAHSVDFICSNNTFEHIPPKVLSAIITEFSRVLKEDGIMSHFIDMTDHFAHFDSSISIYNFLSFSPITWSLIDNDIQPQNRLRYSDYIKLYILNNISINDYKSWSGDQEALKQIKLAEQYQNYPLDDLAISHCYLVSTHMPDAYGNKLA